MLLGGGGGEGGIRTLCQFPHSKLSDKGEIRWFLAAVINSRGLLYIQRPFAELSIGA